MEILFILKSLWNSKKGVAWSLQTLLVVAGLVILLMLSVYFLWGNIGRMDNASGVLTGTLDKVGSRG